MGVIWCFMNTLIERSRIVIMDSRHQLVKVNLYRYTRCSEIFEILCEWVKKVDLDHFGSFFPVFCYVLLLYTNKMIIKVWIYYFDEISKKVWLFYFFFRSDGSVSSIMYKVSLNIISNQLNQLCLSLLLKEKKMKMKRAT